MSEEKNPDISIPRIIEENSNNKKNILEKAQLESEVSPIKVNINNTSSIINKSQDSKNNNSQNNKGCQRVLYIYSVSPKKSPLYKSINTELNDFFNIPEKYFSSNSPIAVGKKVNIKELESFKKTGKIKNKLPLTERGSCGNSPSLSVTSRNIFNKNVNNKNKPNSNYMTIESIDQKEKFEYIDNEKLKNLFDSYKNTNYTRNSKIYLDEIISEKKVPFNISNSLYIQNKKLNDQSLTDRKNKRMSKYLSRKINIKENQLLFNNVDIFRMKNNVLNEIESNKPVEEKFGTYKWNLSLRMNEKFKGFRDNYYNLSKVAEPLWSIVVERKPKNKEISVKPGIYGEEKGNKNFDYFKKNQFLPEKHSSRVQSVENIESINIKGKNLYNVELKREMSSSKRKILHKIFVENGKIVLGSEINNTFGNKTLYKNYQESNTEESGINFLGPRTQIKNDIKTIQERKIKESKKIDFNNEEKDKKSKK